MATRFDTTPYKTTHNKEPKGRGSWAFAPTANADAKDMYFSPSMTYTEAKKWFKSQVPDAVVVYVMG